MLYVMIYRLTTPVSISLLLISVSVIISITIHMITLIIVVYVFMHVCVYAVYTVNPQTKALELRRSGSDIF